MLAAILGTAIPLITEAYWPNRPSVRNLPALFAYVALVLWDIILANIAVARIVLFKPNRRHPVGLDHRPP